MANEGVIVTQRLFNKLAELLASVAKLPTQVVLAYSGGVDSEVLAHLLSRYAAAHSEHEYLLLHVHHGLSPNADDWASHCLTRASGYQLDCQIKKVKLSLGSRASLEAVARDARYQALKSVMKPNSVLLTAHHQDDQLETILLALKRGLGPKGLAAMGEIQPFNHNGFIVRPLLAENKEVIEAYASFHQLSHIEDESNQDTRFDRNFLRQEIIPQLKSRWGSIATTASRSAFLCAEQQAVLEEEVSCKLPSILASSVFSDIPVIDLTALVNFSKSWQALLVRGFIEQYRLPMPSKVQLDELIYQLLNAKEDAQVDLQFNRLKVRRYRDVAFFVFDNELQHSREITEKLLAQLNDQKLIVNHEQAKVRLVLPEAVQRVSVDFGAQGQKRCAPHNRQHGREFKKLMQEYGVPPWFRKRLPLVMYDGKLACVPGLWVEKAFLARRDEPGIDFYGISACSLLV